MKTSIKSFTKLVLQGVLALLCLTLATGAHAANLIWDANGATTGTGGTGNWTGGSTWTNTTTLSFQAWADGNNAILTGTAGNITLNANVVVANITNSGAIASSIIGSGVNYLDFGSGGTIASGGNAANIRISARLKGAVTLNPLDSTLVNTAAIWVKANNTNLTSMTVFPTSTGGNIIADDPGVFGPASSALLITNGGIVNLGALTSDTIGGLTGSGGGMNFSNVTTTLGGGYLRSRSGSNTWNGPITLTAANSGFITRAAAGVAMTLASTATINLNANTLVLNTASAGGALTLSGVISGSGGLSTLVVPNAADGNGLTMLGAANTFSGVALTSQNLGTLALNNVNALQNATLNTGLPGSQSVTFVVAGNNTYNLGALTGSNSLVIGGNTISVGTKAVDTIYGGVISGANGALTKVGANKLSLAATNTYTGVTTISAGTLALASTGALASASSVVLAAGATFDVSAQTTYTHGSSASLTASGTGTTIGSTAAEIKGGTTVDLGSRPVTLNFAPTSFSGDSTHPSLYISTGALTINGGITVNNTSGTALGNGTYVIISQASGSISGTPSLGGTVGGSGIVSGKTSFIQVSGGNVQLVVQDALASTTTLARHAGTGASTTYGDTLQFDVTVSGSGPTPTGTVELRDGGVSGTLIGSVTLASGSVTITPAVNALTAGSHPNIVALYLGDSSYQSSFGSLSTQTVAQKALTVSGATAANKFYDTTTTATITGGSLVGVVSGDALIVTLVQSGNFVTAGPGSAISVTGTCSLTGLAAANYSLTQPVGVTADIIGAAIWTNTVSGTWSTNANWTNNLVGTGANVIADFSQVDITSDIIVTNDVNRTIGNLIFGDADNSTAAGWFLTNNTVTLAGTTPTVTVNALGTGKQVTINSVVAGTSGLTKKGPGTLTLAGANTYTGGTVVSNGIINFNADSAFGTTPVTATPGNIVLDGGAIALTLANQTVAANRGFYIGANGGVVSNAVFNSGNLTISGVIAGPGALTIGSAANAGVILNAQNTYSGGSILNGPASATIYNLISTVGSPGSLVSGPFGTNTITFNGPGMRSSISADTTNGNAIVAAADIAFPSIASEKTLTWEGSVTLSGGSRTFTVNIGANVAGKSLTVNSVIGDGGNGYALTKAGSGTLVLSAVNTFSGGITNSGGILTVNNNGALGTNALTISSGATRVVVNDGFTITNNITINGGGASFRGLIENSGAGNATLTNGTITINSTPFAGGHFASTGGGTLTIADPINSSVNVSLRTGTAIFSGGGSYTDFSITGTGRLGANNGLSTSATVDIGFSGAGTLDLAGFNQTLVGIKRTAANAAIVTNSSTTSDSMLTLTGSTTVFPGLINDSGVAGSRIALVVNGGANTLSGANTYSGNTTISAGTLNLTGSLGVTAVTNVGGTLTGTGVINGAVVVQGAAVLKPGVSDSLGESLTINNNLTLAGTTIVQIGAAPACDSIAGVANINYGGTLIVTNATGATLAAGNTFNLFSASGTKLNNFTSVVLLPTDPTLVPSFNPTTGVLILNSAAPPTLTVTNLGGGSLQFSWTGGGTLQAQTNSLSAGLGTNWVDYPGSSPVTVPVDTANGSVFFRVKQ